MKLAFSTLGVPGLPLADVLGLATAHGYHGVELRTHPEEPVHPGLGPAERADAAARFNAAGVQTVQGIAKEGIGVPSNNPQLGEGDGTPKNPVVITSVK